ADGVVDKGHVQALSKDLNEAEVGRRLFELAAACRAKGIDPEGALRNHAAKVVRDVERRSAATA
ncbi:MAG: MazG family protein, partial [Verrucomicrobiota bacterium]|nr:MazG family protein [Verrucomicrobiota bacterium]